jgi:hypothetical protein
MSLAHLLRKVYVLGNGAVQFVESQLASYGMCRLCFQGSRIHQARNQPEASGKLWCYIPEDRNTHMCTTAASTSNRIVTCMSESRQSFGLNIRFIDHLYIHDS